LEFSSFSRAFNGWKTLTFLPFGAPLCKQCFQLITTMHGPQMWHTCISYSFYTDNTRTQLVLDVYKPTVITKAGTKWIKSQFSFYTNRVLLSQARSCWSPKHGGITSHHSVNVWTPLCMARLCLAERRDVWSGYAWLNIVTSGQVMLGWTSLCMVRLCLAERAYVWSGYAWLNELMYG
jgi:hypothetical protein